MAKDFEKELRDKLQALAILEAREDLLTFIKVMHPTFIVGKHHRIMCEKLMALERGDILRLMIFMPPRSSKSLIISRYFPAWALGRHPEWEVLSATNTADLATFHGRETRNIVSDPIYAKIFPRTKLRADSRAANIWNTNHGGIYVAAGVDTGIAGRGYNLGIIDDPHNEKTAYSKSERESVLNWYPGAFIHRQQPNARIVITSMRWHQVDLPGWLLAEEASNPPTLPQYKWQIVEFPAILHEHTDHEESYFPEWKPLEELRVIRDGPPAMPRYKWDAIFMQRPTTEGGGILKKNWWMRWDRKTTPPIDYILMTMDTAFSERERADFSAITTWGVFKDDKLTSNYPHMILLDARRGHWSYPKLKESVLEEINEHEPDTIIIEDKASGQSLIQDLRESGIPVLTYKPQKGNGKEVRVHASSSVFASSRIWAPTYQWADDVIDECATFPNGEHDDYVDATTMAVLWLKSGGWVPADPEDEDNKPEPFNVVKYYT